MKAGLKSGRKLRMNRSESTKKSLPDEQEGHTTPIYILTVLGVTVKQFKTHEKAYEIMKELEEDPRLFFDIHERQAEDWTLPYVSFYEDEEKDAGRTNG